MVTIKQIEDGIATYLDSELMPKLPNSGLEKVIVGTALSLFIRKSGTIIGGYKDNKAVQMLGVMDHEGNVDVDLVYEELKKNIPDNGVKIEVPIIGGMTFHKEDFEKLYEYISLS